MPTNKIDAGKKKLDDIASPARAGRWHRPDLAGLLCPGDDSRPANGRALGGAHALPMPPAGLEADEIEKPGTYNVRRDKLSTVWPKVFGYNHGIMIVDRFYESVYLHSLQ